MKASLKIRDLSLFCFLGCLPGEQDHQQEVRVSLEIIFSEQPGACFTDKIEDTINYSLLCEKISETACKKKYFTVEHLTREIVDGLKDYIPKQWEWSISLVKVNPPIEGLKQGVEFKLSHL